jgi:non-specific serine/threonine protein kinase
MALAEFEAIDDGRGVGWALSFLGHEARARADLARAADFLQRAVAAFSAIGDTLNVISPLAALGFTVALQGDAMRAMALLEESVARARRTGSKGRLAIASIYFGQVATAQGEMRRAADAWHTGLRLSREWSSAWGMAECLEGLAVMAGVADQPERAARLLGAAARLRSSIGAPVHPVDRADHERTVAAVQVAIGAPADASAWATGQAMPLDDVIEYAITGREIAPPPTSPGVTLLTTRELEVTALIARGLSNRDIADKLVISERTVTSHIEHIFNKLGFRSRAQVAAWATEQRLTLDKP